MRRTRFTLIELLVVIAFIAILASFLLYYYTISHYISKVKESIFPIFIL